MYTINKLIELLEDGKTEEAIDILTNGETIFITWHIDDVEQFALSQYKKKLSKKACKEILADVEHAHDCEIGISWETIGYAIGEYINRRKK